jgi:hypothetical protein
MKKYILFFALLINGVITQAQDFDKNLSAARTSYSSGNLQDSRFAMEQMLRDLDIQIGKEILKMLPTKMGALTANEKEDNLNGSGGMGLFVHRTYGAHQSLRI